MFKMVHYVIFVTLSFNITYNNVYLVHLKIKRLLLHNMYDFMRLNFLKLYVIRMNFQK